MRFPANDIITLVGDHPRYDLGESVGPDVRLGELLEPGDDLGALQLGYGTVAGDPALRGDIARAHGVDADDVVITVGGVHALFLLAFVLCAPGDEVVIATPFFPQAENGLQAVGAAVRRLQLTFADGYRLDLERLRSLLSPRTRFVSLASPQNPSGVAVRPDELRAVLALLDERAPDALLLVDETYREAVYGDDPVAPSALALDRRVVSVASLSKCHGAPGLRIGWAITRDAALREQLIVAKFNTVIACSTVDEALARAVLARSDRLMPERRRRLAEGVAATAAWAAANDDVVAWVRPDAGALSCVRLRPDVFDDAGLAAFSAAAAAAGVRLSAGSWFGDEPRVFRLGFGFLPLRELQDGLAALGALLHGRVPERAP